MATGALLLRTLLDMVSWMKMSHHYVGLSPWGYCCCKQAHCFTTVFFSVFLALIQVGFNIMHLRTQVIEPFKALWHELLGVQLGQVGPH